MRKLIASSSFHKGCLKNQLILLNARISFLNSIKHFSTSSLITNSESSDKPHKKSFNENRNQQQHHYSHPHKNESYRKRDTTDNFKYFDEDSSNTRRRNDNNNRRQRHHYSNSNNNNNRENNYSNNNRENNRYNSKQNNQRRNNFDISRPVDNSVENEVNSMVNRLLSKSRPSIQNKNQSFTENKYKNWNYPNISTKCPESLDFKKSSEHTLVSTIVNPEKVERFKSFMLNHVKNNSSFKSKCKSIHYELIFEIFCSEIVMRSNNDPDFAALVEDVLEFHPERIIQSNVSEKKDDSIFSNVSEFLFYDFSAITDMALSHSNFSNEISVWFNTFVQQRYPEDYHLYTEALKTCDMTNPFNYYKKSIPFGRKIVYHMGPTNSGKTHAALTRLSQSENGVYCGPLRLLAQEVFTKMNTQYGCKCNLMTGQERRIIPGANHVACTIEMADLNEVYDVAVVDEIQMISDNQRGAAWTRALLGLQAREIHICGDGSALTIVKNLIFGGDNKSDAEIEIVESENPNYDPLSESDNVDSNENNQNLYHYHQPVAASKLLHYTKTGITDTIDVIPYTRMRPLEISPESLQGSVQNIKDFDCIVTFSRNEIYEIKKMIEINTGIRCCVIYGALPPEVRTEQAELFNDSTNQDPEDNGGQRDFTVLVASDAVGMGLNLNIKRVIFYRMTKYDYSKGGVAPLDVSLVKQIAGRAGRRGFHETGQVTTFYENDLEYLHQCMNMPNEEITKAGLFPEWDQVESFAKVYKAKDLINNPEGCGISLYEVLEKFFALSRIHKDFFFCDIQQVLDLATSIDEAGPKLTLKQKFDFVNAPVPGFDRAKEMHIRYVEDFSNPNIAAVPLNIDMENILRILDKIREKAKVTEQGFVNSVSVYLQEALKNIEFYHRMIDLYLWLANRYPLRFDKEAAEQAREVLMTELTESLLNQTEENKKIKSVGMLKENAPRAFEYVTFKRNNARNEEPLDPSLQGLKRVIIGGKEYFKKNQFQVISRDKVTRDLVDVMVDCLDENTEQKQPQQETSTQSSNSQ